jgi:type IV secretory pathway VirB3-like protein
MTEEPDLLEYKLALGGTRPAVLPFLNMPWVDFVVFLIAGIECLMTRVELLVFVIVPFFLSILMYRKDYNAGRLFVCWARTSLFHLGATALGGTFVNPRPANPILVYRGTLS